MARIVQLLMPTQNIGFQFLALDGDGEILIGTLTQPKTGPVMTWQKVESHYK